MKCFPTKQSNSRRYIHFSIVLKHSTENKDSVYIRLMRFILNMEMIYQVFLDLCVSKVECAGHEFTLETLCMVFMIEHVFPKN